MIKNEIKGDRREYAFGWAKQNGQHLIECELFNFIKTRIFLYNEEPANAFWKKNSLYIYHENG